MNIRWPFLTENVIWCTVLGKKSHCNVALIDCSQDKQSTHKTQFLIDVPTSLQYVERKLFKVPD